MHWKSCIPALMCVLIAVGMTGPAWVAQEPSLIGLWEGLDLSGSVWAHWWTADALARGASPFIGTHSYLPVGLSPVFQYNLLDAILGAPWLWLADTRLGYNLACVAGLTSTGLAAYFLARTSGAQRSGALLSALIIESSSFVALELETGRISQVTLVFFLLALAFLIRAIERPSDKASAVGLGLTAAGTALVYWYYGFALLLAFTVLLIGQRKVLNKGHLWTLALGGGIASLLTVPFVLDLMSQWSSLPGVLRGGSHAAMIEQGREIAILNSRWLLWPIVAAEGVDKHQLGLLTVGLTALAIRTRTLRWKSWAALATVGWLLAMGPLLQTFSETTEISLPFGWLQALLPTFDRMWWPYRFEVLTLIPCAILAGHALDGWVQGRKRPVLWLGGALILSLVDAPLRSDSLPIESSQPPHVEPELYNDIDGPIFTTPVRPRRGSAERLMYAQTMHGQPTQNGDGEHINGHTPPGYDAWMDESRLVQVLTTLLTKGSVQSTVAPDDVEVLLDAGFEYVAADATIYEGPNGKNWAATHGRVFEAIWGRPSRVTRTGAVWKISPIQDEVVIDVEYARGTERATRRRSR